MKLKYMLPFLDEEDLAEVVLKIKESDTGVYQGVKANDLLPFLGSDLVDKLLADGLARGEDVSNMIPFASKEGLHQVVEIYKTEGGFKIMHFLPFLSKKDIADLFISANRGDVDLDTQSLLPFVGKDVIDEMFTEQLDNGKLLDAYLPFVSKEALHQMVLKYMENQNFDLTDCLPFLAKEDIAELFVKANNGEIDMDAETILPFVKKKVIDAIFIEKMNNGEIIDAYLPFVSKKAFHQIALDFINGNKAMPIDELLTFMPKEDIKMIMKYVMGVKHRESDQSRSEENQGSGLEQFISRAAGNDSSALSASADYDEESDA